MATQKNPPRARDHHSHLAMKARMVLRLNHGVKDMAKSKKKKSKKATRTAKTARTARTPARKSVRKSGAARKTKSARKSGPARKAGKAKSRKTGKATAKRKTSKSAKTARRASPRKAAKTAGRPTRKAQKTVGEGDYEASRAFLKDQSNFVTRNRSKIAQMGEAAEAALEGPEGASLKSAEAEAASHSKAAE
jgi:hypothetical protein